MPFKIMCLADLHLTEKKPPCRPADEDWIATIDRKFRWLSNLCIEQKVDIVVIAGDVFDHPTRDSNEFLVKCMGWFSMLPTIVAMEGNHDLINADLNSTDQTAFGVMRHAGLLTTDSGIGVMPYGSESYGGKEEWVIGHVGLWLKEKPYATAPDKGNVGWFVNNCLPKTCRLFITGHFHKPFVTKVNDTVVVNCGNILRNTADQIDYKPYVTILTTEDDGVIHPKKYPVPLECDIRRDYIDDVKDRNEAMEEMIGDIDGDFENSLNFRSTFYNMTENLEEKEAINKEFERCLK